jgi:hypothetical protein
MDILALRFLSASLEARFCRLCSGQRALFFHLTWTALGYGDYAPLPPIPLVAALQALFRYGFLD